MEQRKSFYWATSQSPGFALVIEYGSSIHLWEGWGMVKSEICRDAETLVWKSETKTWKFWQNPSLRLCTKKTEPETSFCENPYVCLLPSIHLRACCWTFWEVCKASFLTLSLSIISNYFTQLTVFPWLLCALQIWKSSGDPYTMSPYVLCIYFVNFLSRS